MRIFIGLIFCVLFHSVLNAQNSLRHFIPFELHTGASFANLETLQGKGISQWPGLTLSLSSGYMLRYKDRVGISINAGLLLNEYRFTSNDLEANDYYSIAHFGPSSRVRAFAFFPLKNKKHSVLSIAASGGMLFIDNGELNTSYKNLAVYANIAERFLPFIEPEIGLTKLMKHKQLDLAFTYHYSFGPTNIFNVKLSSNSGISQAETRLNYASFVARFDIEVFKNREKKIESPIDNHIPFTPIKNDFELYSNRAMRSNVFYELNRKRMVIKIRDNSELDGDSVSIFLNRNVVLYEYLLGKKYHKVRLRLEEGKNSLVIVANNEGSVPPNTGECKLRWGFIKKKMNTSVGLNNNEEVILNVGRN